MIYEIALVTGLRALGVSVSPVVFAVLRQSGRSLPRSMNCPDSIFNQLSGDRGKSFAHGHWLQL